MTATSAHSADPGSARVALLAAGMSALMCVTAACAGGRGDADPTIGAGTDNPATSSSIDVAARPTPTADSTTKAGRATARARDQVAEATQEAFEARMTMQIATRHSAKATLSAGVEQARATEAALPTPVLLVARGEYQESGDVAAIGVGRVAAVMNQAPSASAVDQVPFLNSVLEHDVNPSAGVAVWGGGGPGPRVLTVYRPPEAPRQLVQRGPDDWIESPRISHDGKWVAYAVHNVMGADDRTEIRVAAVDGSSDRSVAVGVEAHAEPGFRLAPLTWTEGDDRVLLESTSDSEGTPRGLQQVDVATGEVTRARTPDETLWSPVADPSGRRVAYSTFEWDAGGEEGPAPVPPYRLKVLDTATGDAVTLLENDEHQYGQAVWSPEGGRLLVPVAGASWADSVVAVHMGTGEELPLMNWAGWSPPGLTDSGLSVPVPVAWLPGEVVVFTGTSRGGGTSAGDQLWGLDIDEPSSSDPGGAELRTWEVKGPPAVGDVLGYLDPQPPDAPESGAAKREMRELGSLTESPGTRSNGPDGWYARLLTGDSEKSGLWRSVLEIVGPAGERWTAIDEYVPGAICGVDMNVVAWPANGTVLFSRPNCGDGCWRFGGPWNGFLMTLATGEIEPIDGGGWVLSPNEKMLASYQEVASSGGTPVADVVRIGFQDVVANTEVHTDLPVSDPAGDPAWSQPVWSPDSKYVAVAEVLGGCPTEKSATVFVMRVADGKVVLTERYETPVYPVSWDDGLHVRLDRLFTDRSADDGGDGAGEAEWPKVLEVP